METINNTPHRKETDVNTNPVRKPMVMVNGKEGRTDNNTSGACASDSLDHHCGSRCKHVGRKQQTPGRRLLQNVL